MRTPSVRNLVAAVKPRGDLGHDPVFAISRFDPGRRNGTVVPFRVLECYTVTMIDPLAPTSGIGARLLLAGGILCAVWLAVYWAIV